jgi:hypothetical protein
VVDGSKNSRLYFYNSISRDNTSDSLGDAFKNQLFHIEEDDQGYTNGDADNFLAQGTLPSPYTGDGGLAWTSGNPAFFDDGSTTVEWTGYSYDGDTGETTFTCNDVETSVAGMLFRPDPNKYTMLLIITVDETNDLLYCYGKWSGIMPQNPMGGKLFDLHIDDIGSATDFGGDYVPLDVCDIDGLNGTNEPLPWDLDENTREINDPDCGVYEIQP